MIEIRKTLTLKEATMIEMGRSLPIPITRAAGIAVVKNPFAGRFETDLRPMFEIGKVVGEMLATEVAHLLARPAVAYGKGAIVGVAGEMEQGGACIHPMLGKPMRAAVGGGKAVIVSNVKVGPVGANLDVPLGHKDDVFSFDHFDTLTISVPDAPRPDEIVVALVMADAGRPFPRCGSAPIK